MDTKTLHDHDRRRDDTVGAHENAFQHPREVITDRTLSLNRKRELLARWASDERCVENAPTKRMLDSGAIVELTEVLTALRALDGPKSQPVSRPKNDWFRRHRKLLMGEVIRVRRPRKPWDDDDPPGAPAALTPRRPLLGGGDLEEQPEIFVAA